MALHLCSCETVVSEMAVSEVVGIGQKSTQKYHIACCNVQIGAIIACVSVQFVISYTNPTISYSRA